LRPRLVVIYLVVVLTPLVLLMGLGIRMVSYERDRARRNLETVLAQSLEDIDGDVGVFVHQRERRLLELTDTVVDSATTSPTDLRVLTRSAPWIRQMVLLSRDGQLLYPSPDQTLSATEWQFLDRARDFLTAGDLLALPAAENTKTPTSHGWYTWYWGKGVNFLFWRRTPTGGILGTEVDRVRLLADLIAALPDTAAVGTDDDGKKYTGRCIRLLDSNGATLYQWGAHDPLPDERPVAARRLDAPLAAWSLEYFLPADRRDPVSGGGLFVAALAGGLALALALGGLAVYFYRENTRDLSEAAQRVTFVNQVSHELKTPLTSIRMYAELMEGRLPDDDEKGRRQLAVILEESRRLTRLIANVLTFGRQKHGGLSLHSEPGVIDEAVAAGLELFRTRLEEAGVKIDFRPDAEDRVLFDRDALDQILGNLVSNVEKYAADAGELRVDTRQENGRTTITVSDDGPGIPREHRARIFEPFFRVSNRLTDGVTGAGIGLSIARDLARLHGGDLVLLDTPHGAAFRVTLATPAAPADVATPPADTEMTKPSPGDPT